MADKKTLASAKPKTVKKKVVPIAERTPEQLAKDLEDASVRLRDVKKSHASGELVNPRILGTIRREIARLKTALRAYQPTAVKEKK